MSCTFNPTQNKSTLSSNDNNNSSVITTDYMNSYVPRDNR